MPPVGVGASQFASALATGQAKLWVLLIGVNHYQDSNLPPLRYAALDCQGLGEALQEATHAFPHKEVLIHHDFVPEPPTRANVQASLQRVVSSAQPKDTVLIYFSGHGLLEPNSQQTVLCLTDTDKDQLLNTGLRLQDVLVLLGDCAAHRQLIWLDACHSGNFSLSGARGHTIEQPLFSPTAHLLDVLRQRAAKSRGFYALLSCDQGQQSWEFPDLGHGVFSYYLMRGLRGEAAGPDGIIEADGLYRYVYQQTLQYIDQTNLQLRLINQQKRSKGETSLYPEYSLQTPKRIVEGVGEIILGLKPSTIEVWQERHALILDGLEQGCVSGALGEVLKQEGNFELQYLSQTSHQWSHQWADIHQHIQHFLQQESPRREVGLETRVLQEIATRLLYLRGHIEESQHGDSWLVMKDGIRISRSWLRQELRRSRTAQQVVILDCPGATDLENWVEELKIGSDHGQCILACASPVTDCELFAQVLLEALIAATPQTGLSIASLLAKLQTNLEGLGLVCHIWLSGTQGLIEILPAQSGREGEAKPGREEVLPPISFDAPTPATAPESKAVLTKAVPVVVARDAATDENYARVEQLLLKLIGPIAHTLIEQVSEPRRDPETLIAELTQMLPPHQQAAFAQQAPTLLKVAADPPPSSPTVPPVVPASSPKPIVDPTPPPRMAPSSTELSAEQQALLEKALLSFVGPIAPMLLSQITSQTQNISEVLAEVKLHLTANQRVQFDQQMHKLLLQSVTEQRPVQPEISYANNASGRGAATIAPSIDETFIHACEQELTRMIGPIAKFIVTTKQAENPHHSARSFVEALVDEIPNPQQANEFRQRLLNP